MITNGIETMAALLYLFIGGNILVTHSGKSSLLI